MSKKKTHEEYVKEVTIINPNIVVIGKYVNAKTKIMHKCKIDGYEWLASPNKILFGRGCPKCAGNNRKTKEEYISELLIKNPTIELIGEYSGVNKKTTHHCIKHDIYWDTRPSSILNGCGCKICQKEKIGLANCKSHTQYIKEVEKINPHIIVIEPYIDALTPILHECTIHKIQWKAHPSSILRGGGCYKCGIEKLKNTKTKTNKQYLYELSTVNSNIIPIDIYDGANTPILHKCLVDDYEWYATPANILSGKGCPKCSGNLKRTHEEYVNELILINPNIEVIEQYINANTPILHKCKLDSYEWYATPSAILHKRGCPKCANHINITHEEYVEKVSLINTNIEVLEKYINRKTPILHRCKIHNIEWKAYPSSILRGCGCSKCGSEKIRNKLIKTHEQYVSELEIANPNIVVIDKYVGTNTPILHKCLLDNNEWYASPANILYGYGCPKCNESSGERQIRQWLEKRNIVYVFQKTFDNCRDIRLLPFDFYLPDFNTIIEYDHKQHYEPIEHFGGKESFERTVKHDNIKNEYCKNNGISLLRIPYFKNVEEELNNFLFI